MISSNKIVVISDLHVGSGRLDDCDSELEECFVSFIDLLHRDGSSVKLVINGDFLDFAQAEPWQDRDFEASSELQVELCFTQDQSVEKLKSILQAHQKIFKALARFLCSEGNSLVILPGNHDADFFWPEVRSLFSSEVCGPHPAMRKRLRFHLEQSYRPRLSPQVWIEHGHQYDPVNAFRVKELDPVDGSYRDPRPCWSESSPPIFVDRRGQQRLYECIGTRFMIRYMNKLDNIYPFVDNVKPFSRFVKVFATSALNPEYGLTKVGVLVLSGLLLLVREGLGGTTNLMGQQVVPSEMDLSAIMDAALKKMTETEQRSFQNVLKQRGLKFDGTIKRFVSKPINAIRLVEFLSDNIDMVEKIEAHHSMLSKSPGRKGTLSLVKGFWVDETEELSKAADKILALHKDLKFVIMGHTHSPVESGPYINTGCWTRYYTFDNDEKLRPWSWLKSGPWDKFPYQLAYAEIVPSGSPLVRRRVYKERSKL
jgi:UDP-2,3-diacylglucosamine pyrophosphatase LpxH